MKELAEVGVEAVAFVSVNDAFVMDAWGKNYQPSAQATKRNSSIPSYPGNWRP